MTSRFAIAILAAALLTAHGASRSVLAQQDVVQIVPRPGAPAQAQGAPLQFEVASVKPNKSGGGQVSIGIQPGGRFNASNVTLRDLIRIAYQVQPFQIVGGPDWLSSDRFDIAAKAE